MRWVIDASVAIKWVVEEPDRLAARALLFNGDELIAPEFLLIETANALRSKTARQEISGAQAESAFDAVRSVLIRLVPDSALAETALEIAQRVKHPVYDCVYLACAAQQDGVMVTADIEFLNKLHGQPERDRVRALNSLS